METKRTLNNLVLIRLDKENDTVKELFVDTTFEPEKHCTVTGTIYGLPSHLQYTGKPNRGMPWESPLEAKIGDGVILYYLSVVNALKPKEGRHFIEDGERYVLIPYQFIFALVRDEKIIPINGYVLIEPCADPSIEEDKRRMSKLGLELIVTEKRSNSNVTYGVVRYVGIPNRRYVDEGSSDEGVDVSSGDTVIIRKTNDIPLQYDLHAKIDGGAKYYRVQRRNLLAKI